jgi:hypothetical protein
MAPGAAHGGAGAEAAVPGDRGRPSVSVRGEESTTRRVDRDVSALEMAMGTRNPKPDGFLHH